MTEPREPVESKGSSPQASSRQEALRLAEAALAAREEALRAREEIAARSTATLEGVMNDLREANEHLVMANLRSQTLAVELTQLYDEATAANQAKDDFFALLSHELRTPLTSIKGWADLLVRNPDPATIAEAARSIATSAALQAKLVDDLLDVSRIVTGKFSIIVAKIDLSSVVEDAASAVRPQASALGLSLRTNVKSSIIASGDAVRLRQVVGNLLANAIKFTPPGGLVEVSLALDDSFALVEVCDTGEGITSSFLPDVFDRHAQADAKRFGGLGLGLAIVKHIVELHGGSVKAASQGEGKGSTFSVRIPVIRLD
jgi:signal transduction histidine kinase